VARFTEQSAASCQARCARVEGCYFWTWNTAESANAPLQCFLKDHNATDARKFNAEHVSGPRQCPGNE
jgi:hypothetical protein